MNRHDPAAPASPPQAGGVGSGVEMALLDHHRAMTLPPPPRSRFVPNLALIVVVGVLGTFWFLRHLQPWFTEIAVVGGGVTLWAVLRLALELLGRAGGVDPWASTRRHLASGEWTVLLATALVVVLALWAATASIYLRFDAGSARAPAYEVSVGTRDAAGTFIAKTRLTAAEGVIGRPVFGWTAPGPLVCRIEGPARFEDLDCTLDRWGARVVRVPGSFEPKPMLLLRLLPDKALWTTLPTQDVAAPPRRYDLVVQVDGQPPRRLPDLRMGAVDLGADAADLKRLAEQRPEDLRARLRDRLLGEGVPGEVVDRNLSAFVDGARVWDGFRLRPGQTVTVDVVPAHAEGASAAASVPGFPIRLTADDGPFQVMWLTPKESR